MNEQPRETVDLGRIATAALTRFGQRLDEDQRRILLAAAAQLEEAADALRAFELANADEPDFTFGVVERPDR